MTAQLTMSPQVFYKHNLGIFDTSRAMLTADWLTETTAIAKSHQHNTPHFDLRSNDHVRSLQLSLGTRGWGKQNIPGESKCAPVLVLQQL